MTTRRQFLKLCFCSAAVAAGLGFFAKMPAGMAAANIPVLLYHRVGYSSGGLTVSPERFAADLAALDRNGYHAVSLEHFGWYLRGQTRYLPDKPVLITFDDGYRDNYENAYPLLQKYAMTGCFFVITGMVGEADRLTAEHIREMVAGGMSFGSHTVSHRPLATLPEEEVRNELSASRYNLSVITGRAAEFIAYPRGSYNDAVVRIARETGYLGGFTVRCGLCSGSSPRYALARVPVFGYDPDIMTILRKHS